MSHGYISCTACKAFFGTHDREGEFERWGHGEPIRLINNPASWGAAKPRFRFLGFSKGETQNRAMELARKGELPFEAIPFKGMGRRLPWLFRGLGLRELGDKPDQVFSGDEGEFQCGSVIKCSISARREDGSYSYKLKDIIDANDRYRGVFKSVLETCVTRHLSQEPSGRAFILLGLDKDWIDVCKTTFAQHYPTLRSISPTTYRARGLSWVHVAHPSGSQTDPQFMRWCEGSTSTAKVVWAREELNYRRGRLPEGGETQD